VISSNSPAATRLLYVVDALMTRAAGTEGQLIELVGALDTSRYEPHIAVFRANQFLSKSTPFPCPVHELDIHKLVAVKAIAGLSRLSRLVARLEARVAHVYFNDASLAAPAFCRLGGARVIVSRRDMGFWYTPTNLTALRLANRFVDRIVANSEAVRRNVHEQERYPLDRIDVIPNGHDPKRFERSADPGLRTRLGIAPNATILGMVANLNPRKRQRDLIQALPAVRATHGDVHLLLVGSGETEPALRRLATDLGVSDRVHILRDVTEAVPIIKLFDVAVLCSESEGLSNALIEYAFCGKPIVCTDVGGNAEVVVDGQTGLLVDRGDIEGLAQALIGLLASPTRQLLGERGYRTAVARYSRSTMVSAYTALYDELQEPAAFRGPAHQDAPLQ